MIKRNIILVVFFLLVSVACDDQLDVQPQQSIESDKALSNPENVISTLRGAYQSARSRWLFGSQFNEYSELLASSGDLMFVGSHKEPQQFMAKEINVTNSYVENTWDVGYETINILNTVKSAIDVLDDSEQDRVLGEVLFLRGWLYFNMVRLWGLPYEPGQTNDQPGVPLVLDATLSSEDAIEVERASVHQCYEQIISDLKQARDLLPAQNGVYANTYAASAILSRVYLQQSKFELAATEANRVIEEGGFSLVNTPHNEYNNESNTSEDIFAFQNSLTDNTIWLTQRYASLNGMGRGDYQMSEDFFSLFNSGDLRGQIQQETYDSYTYEDIDRMYYIGVGPIRSGGINTYKYGNYYAVIPSIRLAEMYLTRAEANHQISSQVGPNTPTQDINTVRSRASAEPLPASVTTKQIRNERYRELCWEGFRLHDLKRWKKDIAGYSYDAGNLILPIPAAELEVNDKLEQNPYYK